MERDSYDVAEPNQYNPIYDSYKSVREKHGPDVGKRFLKGLTPGNREEVMAIMEERGEFL